MSEFLYATRETRWRADTEAEKMQRENEREMADIDKKAAHFPGVVGSVARLLPLSTADIAMSQF